MSDLQIGKYKIDPVLFEKGFAKGCGPYECQTTCCSSGVWVDVKECDVVLSYKEQIKKYMDDSQTTDDSKWFDAEEIEDHDFESARAIGTAVFNNKCTFLKKSGQCSIQLFSGEELGDRWKIKPFYCIAFPITVVDGLLTFDDYQQDNAKCCSIVSEGKENTLVDSCKDELVFMLGEEDYKKLQHYEVAELSKMNL